MTDAAKTLRQPLEPASFPVYAAFVARRVRHCAMNLLPPEYAMSYFFFFIGLVATIAALLHIKKTVDS
jgi:hypothetical protein